MHRASALGGMVMAYVYHSISHSSTGCKAKANMQLARCSWLLVTKLISGDVYSAMMIGQMLVPMVLTLCILAPLFILNRQMGRIEVLAARMRAEQTDPGHPNSIALIEFEEFTARQKYRFRIAGGQPITIFSASFFAGGFDYVRQWL